MQGKMWLGIVVMWMCMMAPQRAWAASEPAPVARAEKTQGDDGRLRGLYVESRFAAGYMVLSEKIPAADGNTGTAGKNERLGGAVGAQLALGYDLGKWISLEVLGGMNFASGTRSDRVRDMGILYAGMGGRVAIPLSERFSFNAGLAAGYASSSNGVETASGSVWGQVTAGAEYALFIRHFSLGCDLSLFTTIQPTRMFVGITPRLKYTF